VLGKMTPTLIVVFKEEEKNISDVVMPHQDVGKWVWGVGVSLVFLF
jgi:hypothetical protein